MALLSETNEQYYGGQQAFVAVALDTVFVWTGDTTLVGTTTTSFTNFQVKVNNVVWTEVSVAPVGTQYRLTNTNEITTPAMAGGEVIVIELLDDAKWANYGSYEYIKMNDLIDNFMVGYVGEGKLINHVKRSDVLFHVKRGLQEFSYDVFKTIKSQEVELSPSLSIPMPQDYVSYIKLSFIGSDGIKRIIYPTRLTVNPTEAPTQDSDYNYVYDNDGNIISGDSYTETKWQAYDTDNITGNINANDDYFVGRDDRLDYSFGGRHGLEPEHQQINGYFTIDERTGSFAFSSDLSGKIITIEYVSDSLGTDAEMKVRKFAEEALYEHIAFNVLAAKRNIPEYIEQRYKKERRAALRNAKIRLSDIKLEEFTQVMRGKSKWIKH